MCASGFASTGSSTILKVPDCVLLPRFHDLPFVLIIGILSLTITVLSVIQLSFIACFIFLFKPSPGECCSD